ncbi:MAG TPA: M50 family metallopeptidase [Herpetosiphonaceae bacterium]
MRESHYFVGWRQREVLLVLGLALATIVAWRMPVVGWVLYPFQVYGTFVHELSHGIAAILTGGAFRRFVVNPDLSGTALSAGGIGWIVVSAGYIGSAIFGGILTLLSASAVSARRVLVWLGLTLGVMSLLFVRNLFGLVAGVALAALLVVAGRRLRETWADGLLLLLAVQMMLSALDSVVDLVQISALRGATRTDAQIMAQMTGIPAIAWAGLWSLLSLAILVGTLRLAYRRTPPGLLDDEAGSVQPRERRGSASL